MQNIAPPSDFLTPPSPLAVLDGLPTGLAILDNNGRIWYMNDACRQLLGVFSSNPADIAGSDSYVALLSICNAERDTIVEALNSVAAGERTRVDLEQSIVVDGQRRWIELTIAAYAFDNAMGIIVEHRDISARKQAEALRMALYRIADLTSSAEDMTSFYAAIHQVVAELMYARNFYIVLLDRESGMLHFPYHVDEFDPPPASRPPKRGLTEYVLRTGQPLLAPAETFFELAEQGEVEVVGEPCVDWLGVPLKQGEATFGVVAVQSYTPSVRFSEREKELLTFVGQQLAVALERKQAAETVRLSKAQAAEAAAHAEAAERQARTMEMVHRLSQALSSRHDEQEILDLAARELVGMFWADHTSIVLFDDDGRWGIVVAEAPVNEAVGLRFAAGEDALLVELQESRRPVYVESIASDPRPLRSRDQLLHLGYVSLMLVPLIVRDRIIGAIQLDSAGKARHFTQAEQDLFLTLANAIAAAIENARLYASVQQELAERVRAEQERSQLQEEIIRMQQSLLAELSTPLFPISDYVVVMPLVGAIDSNRARGIIEALLHGVQEHRARVAILDITGVPVVDTQVANALMHAAQSVRLLGAQVILTGIRPEVAQTMVGLGVELGSIITRGTLQDAIKFVLSGR